MRQAIEAFELPMEPAAEIDPDRMLEAMQRDKKVRAGTVRFALPTDVGTMAFTEDESWTHALPIEEIRGVLEGWRG